MTAVGRSPRRVLDDATGIAIRRLEDRIRELEAATRNISSNTGGTAVTYGSVSSEVVGGPNVDGAATKAARSDHIHALPDYGSTAGTFCQGNDSRLSDSRTPTGAAGGDLSASYPNPNVAAVHETSGPTQLTLGAIADTQILQRSGTTLVGVYPPSMAGFPTTISVDTTVLAGQSVVMDGPLVITSGVTLTIGPGAELEVLGGGVTYATVSIEPPAYRPHACDDDFTGALDAKWSTWNPGGNIVTVGTDPHLNGVVIAQSGNGTDRNGGIYQAVPASEFAAIFQVSMMVTAPGRWSEVGIFIGDSNIQASPTTAKFESLILLTGSSGVAGDFGQQWLAWTNYTTAGTVHGISIGVQTSVWMRMRVNGTSLGMEWSTDGIGWYFLNSTGVTMGFTPAYFGVLVNMSNNGITSYGICRRVRVLSGPNTSFWPNNLFAKRLNIPLT